MTKVKKYLFIIVVFFVVFQSKAQEQVESIEINLYNASVKDLAENIEKQGGYRFYYEQTLFDSLKVNINHTKASLKEILNKAFKGTDFKYAIYGKAVFLTKDKEILTELPSQFTGRSKITTQKEDIRLAADISTKTVQIATLENKLYTIGKKTAMSQTTGTLAGNIKNVETGEPISGVSVFVDKPRIGAITNEFGFYSLTLPLGKHEINIRAVGLKDTRRQILLQGDGKLDINLTDEPFSLKEVVITTEKASNIRRTQMGIEKLDIKTIKQVPTVFGEADILRVVLTLPGVKSVGESSTGFNVRGGSVDQNLILFNDATIYNPSHFFGFFSAFNPEVIKDVQLYKGSLPAKYGGRLSSVLELNSREGNKKAFTGTAGIGLITSRLNIEGPLIKDKTSFIVGGRTTYSNWITDLLPEKSGYRGAKASFYDINLHVSHQQNDKNSFYATGYFSNDKSNLATDTTFMYSNQNVSLRWKHSFNNKLYGILSGGYDKYSYNNYSKYKDDVDYKLKFAIGQTNLKTNFNYYPTARWNIDFGGSTIYYKNYQGSLEPYSDKSLVVADILQTEQALESAVFAEHRYDLTDAITLNAGLRYSFFNYLGPANVNIYADGLDKTDANIVTVENYGSKKTIKTYHSPEYRLGARIAITPDFSVKAGYNTQRQYIHMLSNTTSISPTDVWKLSDRNIAPQHGSQVSVGLYKNFKANTIETSIEAYHKKINNFLDYKSGAVLILNHKIEQDVLPTQGKAYGIEFLVKKLTGKLNGWLSYTYSRTLLKTEDVSGSNSINDGKYYPANYDKPHDFTLIGNYRFSHRVSFSLNLTYSTGRPITLPVGKYYYAGGQRLLYSERNQYRIPDYLRSDISFNILGNHKKTQLTHSSWTFGVYNLTGRKNVFSTFFSSENKLINGYQLSIFGTAIPYVNYNIRFK
ncbi:TonB-dependent receptor plug [Pseudopedobacter saltans DSM 12145]|uniref:TonB-dependent receptor plug n=1 Tax=Pseudopedobacter saltans (strain ATCC 51119 / DSM 12145 / JCM 21818 / CCUG 39354 / LMG 10337 / NBRC 100064 / NCIMB 13643) TaxID=762903 RepID=F0S4T5_PSESL|nr:TonB-dependent receptor [Pseudopedobacter saltans]ADY53103.1 TonB-dependent receptor plug [Pseudopedobacter saltans DSM 12145]